jgi:hypothetical protein
MQRWACCAEELKSVSLFLLRRNANLGFTGVYILKNTLPPGGGGGISADVIWGKNMKRRREKGGNCKKKGRKGKEKFKKGKENEGKKKGKINVKGRIKAKRPCWESKSNMSHAGENKIFRKGAGNKDHFRTKI